MLFTRSILEDNEDQYLAPYAVRSKNSKGRKYLEDEPDYRTCFQRDRDRVLHTTAFRRLEYKTQVFINYEGDYYRTRLTHTLEVTQIGRTIARAVGANEDLVEVICLAHDLGHPPFGHSGEKALAQLLMDFGGFEHNKQSFRIVTELEKRYVEFNGLNLSWEVLEGLVKHETEYDKSDAKEFNPELHANLEAQICNVADELAYTAHDLDDGLRSGMITLQMLEGIDIWNILTASLNWNKDLLEDIDRHRLIRRLIGIEVTDLVNTTINNLHSTGVKTVEDIQRHPYSLVTFSNDTIHRNRQLKDFLYKNLYRNYRVIRMAVKAEKILSELYQAYVTEPKILPTHIFTTIDHRGLERTICDYIAGMTDRFAVEEHQKLFDPITLP